jgi:hypothetical protein
MNQGCFTNPPATADGAKKPALLVQQALYGIEFLVASIKFPTCHFLGEVFNVKKSYGKTLFYTMSYENTSGV